MKKALGAAAIGSAAVAALVGALSGSPAPKKPRDRQCVTRTAKSAPDACVGVVGSDGPSAIIGKTYEIPPGTRLKKEDARGSGCVRVSCFSGDE